MNRNTKRFSDWFGMTQNGSETDSGMVRNSSDSLGMNFNRILSPGELNLKIFENLTLKTVKDI